MIKTIINAARRISHLEIESKILLKTLAESNGDLICFNHDTIGNRSKTKRKDKLIKSDQVAVKKHKHRKNQRSYANIMKI